MTLVRFRAATFAFAAFRLPAAIHAAAIDLSGAWQFPLAAANSGVKERWFTRPLTDTITLPSSTDTAGFGQHPDFRVAECEPLLE